MTAINLLGASCSLLFGVNLYFALTTDSPLQALFCSVSVGLCGAAALDWIWNSNRRGK